MNSFDQLESLLKILWIIALPASAIFIIQAIITFLGSDASDGISADFDGNLDEAAAPFQLFTLRNLINFLLVFSWSGIALYHKVANKPTLLLVSFFSGLAFVAMFFVMMRQIEKLAENNAFRIMKAVGRTAEVYVSIPGMKCGKGKILVSVNGAYHELDAMTEQESLSSGTIVKVLKILDDSILLVEKI